MFEDEKPTGTSGFSGIVAAIRTHFGSPETEGEVGANLTANYQQQPKETLRAFMERIKRHFTQGLNTEWAANAKKKPDL